MPLGFPDIWPTLVIVSNIRKTFSDNKVESTPFLTVSAEAEHEKDCTSFSDSRVKTSEATS